MGCGLVKLAARGGCYGDGGSGYKGRLSRYVAVVGAPVRERTSQAAHGAQKERRFCLATEIFCLALVNHLPSICLLLLFAGGHFLPGP
jgi:hypothetical protein